MENKIKPGDIVIGNHLANNDYSYTTDNTLCLVLFTSSDYKDLSLIPLFVKKFIIDKEDYRTYEVEASHFDKIDIDNILQDIEWKSSYELSTYYSKNHKEIVNRCVDIDPYIVKPAYIKRPFYISNFNIINYANMTKSLNTFLKHKTVLPLNVKKTS